MTRTDECNAREKSTRKTVYGPNRERADLGVGLTRAHHRRQAQPTVSAEIVVSTFNTWAFKREQPDSKQGLVTRASSAIARAQPLSFVLYWGKGPRNAAGSREIACLEFLAQMQDRVRSVYAPGARFTLVFTDTHARLNGHEPVDYAAYFKSVRELLPATGFETCHLASIVRDARPLLAGFDPEQEELDPELLKNLVGSAKKWYRGGGTAEFGALEYYRANLIERKAMELSFPDSIFVTFNGSDLRGLFPTKLPIFYMYSLRKGFAVKPWFLA